MELIVDPVDGPADDVPSVRISGTAPDATVQLVVEVTDMAGRAWRSSTPLRADAVGPGALPRRRSTTPARPGGRCASCRSPTPGGGHGDPAMFAAPPDLLRYQVRVDEDGHRDHARSSAGGRPPAPSPPRASGDGFRTVTFSPAQASDRWRSAAVVLVPGSSRCGQHAADRRAARRARLRRHRAALPRRAGPPPRLQEVPLEHLAAGIRAAVAQSTVEPGHFAVLAASVGSEGVLATLAAFDELGVQRGGGDRPEQRRLAGAGGRRAPAGCLVVDAPRLAAALGARAARQAVRPGGAARGGGPSATPAPQPGAAAPPGLRRRPRPPPGRRRDPAERIDAPLLLLAGEDDQVWPSVDMATRLLDRRARAEDRLLAFPDAGHVLQPPVIADDGHRRTTWWSRAAPRRATPGPRPRAGTPSSTSSPSTSASVFRARSAPGGRGRSWRGRRRPPCRRPRSPQR